MIVGHVEVSFITNNAVNWINKSHVIAKEMHHGDSPEYDEYLINKMHLKRSTTLEKHFLPSKKKGDSEKINKHQFFVLI